MTSSKAGERKWIRDTRSRTEARHEETAALAAAGAASVLASAITSVREDGAEAEVHLRDGGLLAVCVPQLGRIATIRAGDGWASAIVSPKVLGAPGSSATGDTGDGTREPWGPYAVDTYSPGAVYGHGVPFAALPPPEFTGPVRSVVKSVHRDWNGAEVEAEVQRIWTGMLDADPQPERSPAGPDPAAW